MAPSLNHDTDTSGNCPTTKSPVFVWIVALITLGAIMLVILAPALFAESNEVAPTQIPADVSGTEDSTAPCDSCSSKCSACANLHSCAEARQCFEDGHSALDPDGDGIPCEGLCPGG